METDKKKMSEPIQLEHTLAYSDKQLAYLRHIRELGNQLRVRGEMQGFSNRSMFRHFLNSGTQLNSLYKDLKLVSPPGLRPYLDGLYGRAIKKAHLNRKLSSMSKTAPLLSMLNSNIVKEINQKEAEMKRINSRIKPFMNRTNSAAPNDQNNNSDQEEDEDKIRRAQTFKAKPRKSILKTSGSPSRRTSIIQINESMNRTKIIDRNPKIKYDWEIQQPTDKSEDSENEQSIAQDSTIGQSKPEGSDKKPALGDTNTSGDKPTNQITAFPDFLKPKTAKDKVASKVDNLLKVNIDSRRVDQIKKAIEDNRCTMEEWADLKNKFDGFAKYENISLTEGIKVRKYGRRNFFRGDDRRIFFIDNYTAFAWRKENSTTYEKIFKVAEIQGLILGKKTDNIMRFKKVKDENVFSIVMPDRTIDLEIEDKTLRRLLYFSFKFFLNASKRFKSNMFLYECLADDISEFFGESMGRLTKAAN